MNLSWLKSKVSTNKTSPKNCQRPMDSSQSHLKTLIDSIPTLSNSNFSLWRSKIITILSLKGIAHWLNSVKPKKCPPETNLEIFGYILAKLDNQTYINCVKDHLLTNRIKLWKSINEYYASYQTSNCSRAFFNFLNLQFDPKRVKKFITNTRSCLLQILEIGIKMENNIVAYLLLYKFPPQL